MGFDADDAEALDRQRAWVLRSPIPQAMLGVLTALPGTQLERRLAREGRLVERSSGETFCRPNFKTKLPEKVLLESYRTAIEEIYRPEEYFSRCLRALELRPNSDAPFSLPWAYAIRCVLGSVWRQGIAGNYRGAYWRFLGKVLRRVPRRIARAVALAIAGEHMIRYTKEAVLPRLTHAIEEVAREEASLSFAKAHGRRAPRPLPASGAGDASSVAV